MKNKISAAELALCGLFGALITVGAYIKITTPLVPITLQLAAVVLCGLMLGAKCAVISVSAYVLAGLLGLPVFTSGGGLSYVLKPSFGYTIGFVLAAYVTGKISGGINAEKAPSLGRLFAAAFCGLAVIHITGTAYLYFIMNYALGVHISLWKAALAGTIMFLPTDSAWCVLGSLLSFRLLPPLLRHRIRASDGGEQRLAKIDRTTR